MQESFLHYIWQFQYFDKKDLRTEAGETVKIFQTGFLNLNSGPDFTGAKLRIGNVEWVGSVEIHTKASGWYDHGHDKDAAYNNVIAHVVWTNDRKTFREDGTELPTITLAELVDPSTIERYKTLVENPSSIPCEKLYHSVDEIVRTSQFDRALMQRLQAKAEQVIQLLEGMSNDWEEVTYQLLARNFGFKVNYESFFQLANSVPRRILLKHSTSLTQIEALLFGQAGFLESGIKDEYFKELQKEYKFLSSKYELGNQRLNNESWKFMRLRPANFPTIRIAQFSALYHKQQNIFSKLVGSETSEQLKSIFKVSTSNYWHHHYRFGRKTARSISGLGEDSIDNIIINTVVPVLVAYGKHQDDQALVDRAVQFLEDIPPEKNKITRAWTTLGVEPKNAFDTQALIELNNNFCYKRKCLDCNIGIRILKPVTDV